MSRLPPGAARGVLAQALRQMGWRDITWPGADAVGEGQTEPWVLTHAGSGVIRLGPNGTARQIVKDPTHPRNEWEIAVFPMFLAAQLNLVEPLTVLAAVSQDVNALPRDLNQRTLLMVAAEAGALDAVEFLLSKGADPAAADVLGETALHRATHAGRREVVERLLAAGALLQANRYGHTPLDACAFTRDREEIKGLLSSVPRREPVVA